MLLACAAGCVKDDNISRDFGATCSSNADCTQRCLPAPDWPGGFCTRDCTGDGDCQSDAVCVDTSDGDVCLFSCNDDRDCDFLDGEGADWGCVDVGGGGDAGAADRVCGAAP